jgi:DNA-binding response OmpR family regulator
MKLLIIEDDKETREFLKSCLEERGYVIEAIDDGERGLNKARNGNFGLIILDKMLPKMNGMKICYQLRSEGIITPIIVLSVESEIDDKVKMLQLGADDYVTKPFSLEELLARIVTVLRRPKRVDTLLLRVDDLTLDCKSQIAHRGKKEIYLTRKEFLLLECLMREKGNVVSRGQIMEQVWDAQIDPFSNTIEAHILNLRKKVDYNRKHQLIRTVPGRGYKIAV